MPNVETIIQLAVTKPDFSKWRVADPPQVEPPQVVIMPTRIENYVLKYIKDNTLARRKLLRSRFETALPFLKSGGSINDWLSNNNITDKQICKSIRISFHLRYKHYLDQLNMPIVDTAIKTQKKRLEKNKTQRQKIKKPNNLFTGVNEDTPLKPDLQNAPSVLESSGTVYSAPKEEIKKPETTISNPEPVPTPSNNLATQEQKLPPQETVYLAATYIPYQEKNTESSLPAVSGREQEPVSPENLKNILPNKEKLITSIKHLLFKAGAFFNNKHPAPIKELGEPKQINVKVLATCVVLVVPTGCAALALLANNLISSMNPGNPIYTFIKSISGY